VVAIANLRDGLDNVALSLNPSPTENLSVRQSRSA
jgi:hypothetical protein